MKNTTSRNIFWLAIIVAVLLVVVLLGSVIEIANPVIWIANTAIAAVILIIGYILGKKSVNEENTKK